MYQSIQSRVIQDSGAELFKTSRVIQDSEIMHIPTSFVMKVLTAKSMDCKISWGRYGTAWAGRTGEIKHRVNPLCLISPVRPQQHSNLRWRRAKA